MNDFRTALIAVFTLLAWAFSALAGAQDLYNPAKLYYTVFYKETKSGDCYTRTVYSQHFSNGREAQLATTPAGFKRYGAWCWKKPNENCDKEIVWHELRPWCQNSGCRLGIYKDAVVCDKKR